MLMKNKPLVHLRENKTAKITDIHGGGNFRRKLEVMGIRPGQIIKVVSKQPFRGPITISVGNGQMTIGRGMAHRILVEEI